MVQAAPPRTASSGAPGSVEARQGRPALAVVDDALLLAWISWGDTLGATVGLSTSADGDTWSDPIYLDDSKRVIGLVTPVFSSDGHLFWARLGTDDQVEVCRRGATDAAATCRSTEVPAVTSLSATTAGVDVSTCEVGGACALQEMTGW